MTDDQFVVIAGLLLEIRNALVPPDADPNAPCEHPEEQRVSLRTANDPEHFFCRECKAHVGARLMN